MDSAFVGDGSVADEYAAGLDDPFLDHGGVADLVGDSAQPLADDTDATPSTDPDAFLASESCPLVVNLKSHEARAEVTERMLEADPHVLSEKPLADPDVER